MIHVEALTRKFGDVTAIDNVSFTVAAGEIFAFLGPNGAGKTTTIKMLTTLLPPTSGRLAIDGLDPARHSNEVRRRFGIVFQDPSLDSQLSAWENMELHGALYRIPRKARRERSEMLLQAFGLWERKDGVVMEFCGGMLGRTCGAATVAMIQGSLVAIVCLIAGFRPANPALIPAAIAFFALIALVFAALGTAVGSMLKDMQGFQMVMNFLVMPLFFLSGAMYPLDGLPAALALITRLDPLAYGVDGLRTSLIEQSHFGAPLDAAVLICLAVAFVLLGAWRFSKIEV